MEKRTIEHEGIVTKIGEDGVSVMILSQSACASCQAMSPSASIKPTSTV